MKTRRMIAMLLSLSMIIGMIPLSKSTMTVEAKTVSEWTSPEFGGNVYWGTRTDFRDESVYYLMITRFYDGDSGNNVHCWDDGSANNPDSDPAWRGDFKGLIEKLDYIKALGFTAVQLTPVAQNASGYDYHGYHPINMKRIDPRFESEGYTYQDVIDECHARDLKVMQEIVLNSTSNFGEKYLSYMFDVNEDGDLSDVEKAVTPVTSLLDAYGLNSVEEYWAQGGGTQYQQRLNRMKNVTYSADVANSTGSLPQAEDYSMDKVSSSPIYNAENHYHTGYFSQPNYDDWTAQFSQVAGDCVDINTENPDVGVYLAETCKMYADMGVDALYIESARFINRSSLNLNIINPLKEMLEKEGKDIEIFAEVVTRYNDIWYRGHATMSVPYYTWAESNEDLINHWVSAKDQKATAEEINDNMNLIFDQLIKDNDTSNQPESDNALLDGITYHEPDYSRAGLHAYDFNMQYNFGSAENAYSKAVNSDQYFNDATWNMTGVEGFQYSTSLPNESTRFAGGTDAWAENLCLMYTFRGIPRVMYGTEVEFQKGSLIDRGTLLPLSQTGRAYYGDYLEGNVTTTDFGEYTTSESGAVSQTLNSDLSKHIQKLNAIRRAVPALRKGQYTASSDYVSGDMAFIRRYTNEDVDSLALVTVTKAAEFKNIPNGEYVDAVTGDVQMVTDGTLSVDAPGKGDMRVYVCQAEGFTRLDSELEPDTQKFTLSFDGNGATGQMNSIESSASGFVTLPECLFTGSEGKVFQAWKIGEKEYKAGSKIKLTKDETATAVWRDPQNYELYLGNIKVSESNQNDVLGDGTATYNNDTKTLTLDGYHGEGILTGLSNLNIVLSDDSENSILGGSFGICSEAGSVTVKGKGILTVQAEDTAIHANNIHISVDKMIVKGKKKALYAEKGDISITNAIVNALGETEAALSSGGRIVVDNAHVTAVSYHGMAMSKSPVMENFTTFYSVVASQSANGANAEEYTGSKNGTYKYVKVNPYYTVSFSADHSTGSMESIKTESGIITLPVCTFANTDGKKFSFWMSDGKYYLPGAKLKIRENTEFKVKWESGTDGDNDIQDSDNIVYLKNESNWDKVYAYCWNTGGGSKASWPGTLMENIEGTDIWKIAVSANEYANIIFNAGNGAPQTGDLKTPTDGNNMFSNKTNTWTTYSPVIIPEDTNGKKIISFHANGGSGYMKELLVDYDTYTLPFCELIHPKMTDCFVAWNVGGKEYQPGETIPVSGDVQIFAVWKRDCEHLGHSYSSEWSKDEKNHWKLCECGDISKTAAHSFMWVIDKEATSYETGLKHEECSVCKYTGKSATIAKLPETHTHKYNSNWSKDATKHWKECSCKSKKDVASHSFKWVIDKAATLTNTGLKHEECSICGYKKQAVTVSKRKPKKGDSFKDSKKNVYVITDVRKKTVAFKKMGNTKLKSFTVPSTVTLNKQKYKVTQISDNVFKNNKIITKITIGSNVVKIGKNAFAGCKKLKTITVKSIQLKSVGKNALKGIYSNARIKVPKSKYTRYKILFKNKGQGKKVKVTK